MYQNVLPMMNVVSHQCKVQQCTELRLFRWYDNALSQRFVSHSAGGDIVGTRYQNSPVVAGVGGINIVIDSFDVNSRVWNWIADRRCYDSMYASVSLLKLTINDGVQSQSTV